MQTFPQDTPCLPELLCKDYRNSREFEAKEKVFLKQTYLVAVFTDAAGGCPRFSLLELSFLFLGSFSKEIKPPFELRKMVMSVAVLSGGRIVFSGLFAFCRFTDFLKKEMNISNASGSFTLKSRRRALSPILLCLPLPTHCARDRGAQAHLTRVRQACCPVLPGQSCCSFAQCRRTGFSGPGSWLLAQAQRAWSLLPSHLCALLSPI